LLASVTAAVVVIVLVVVGALLVVPAVRSHTAVPAADRYPSWPVRGSLAGDLQLRQAALRTWDAAPLRAAELPHSAVQVLYAGDSLAGKVVVLLGRNALGHLRWAVLNQNVTSTTPYKPRLHLILDQPAGDPRRTRAFAYAGERPTPTKTDDTLAVLVAAPGATGLQWQGDASDWRTFPTASDGAAAEVFRGTRTLNMTARYRDDAGRHTSRGESSTLSGLAYTPDVQARAGEQSCDAHGVCTSSAGGGGVVTAAPKGGRTSLRQGGLATDTEWHEFEAEAQTAFMSALVSGDGGYSFGESWSGLLPDGTGGYLLHGSAGGPDELVLYADHPSSSGGRIVATYHGSATEVPVLTAVVDGEAHPWLLAPAVDGWQVEVRQGEGAWVRATVGPGVRYAPLTRAGAVQVREISPLGVVGPAHAPDSATVPF